MGSYGMPTDEQWSKMQKFIKSDKYKKEDFFVFETQAVGDRVVPNRYTRILPELLEVMKQDAQKGVSLMLNHNWSQIGVQSIPIGKVFDGRIDVGTQEGETTALYVSQYILRDDSKVDGYSKNDIINLIESGIMSDTSIGWGADLDCYICNICGNQYFSGKCSHWKGNKYIIDEETEEVKQCIVEVKAPKHLHAGNNVLMENSVVFDGAYPNAVIQSAGDGSTETDSKFKMLNDKEELEETQKVYAKSSQNHLDLYYIPLEKGGKAMDEKLNNEVHEEEVEVTDVPEAQDAEVTDVETPDVPEVQDSQENADANDSAQDVVEDAPTAETQSSVSFEQSELSEIFGEAEVDKEMLLRLVKDGKMYRDNVISEALNSGVRSLGNAFNKDSFEKTFKLMATEDIKAMGESWEKDVSEKFSSQRVSKDKVPNKNSVENSSEVDYSYLKTSTY